MAGPMGLRYGPLSLLLAAVVVAIYGGLFIVYTQFPEGASDPWRIRLTQGAAFIVIPAAHIGGIMMAFRSFVRPGQGWQAGIVGLVINAGGLALTALLVLIARDGLPQL